MEDDCQNQVLILKNSQTVETISLFNSQVKLSREELAIQVWDRNKILIMSQFQTEDQLHQQLQLFKNYLRKFLDFKMSAIEHNLVHKQKETRTQLSKRNLELSVVL